MDRANRRRTRSNGSGLDQTNGGEVTPTPEAESHMKHLEESAKDVNGNGKGMIVNGVSGEEEQESRTPVTVKKSSGTKFTGSHRELVLGLPCRGQFEIKRSSNKLGGGGKKNVLASSHKRAQRCKEAASVHANLTPRFGLCSERRWSEMVSISPRWGDTVSISLRGFRQRRWGETVGDGVIRFREELHREHAGMRFRF